MKYFLCKSWAYIKYYFIKSNLKYDGMKEPWRFLTALFIVSPWIFTMLPKDVPVAGKIFGIAWILLVVLYRLMWHPWVLKNVGGGK